MGEIIVRVLAEGSLTLTTNAVIGEVKELTIFPSSLSARWGNLLSCGKKSLTIPVILLLDAPAPGGFRSFLYSQRDIMRVDVRCIPYCEGPHESVYIALIHNSIFISFLQKKLCKADC